MEVARVFLDRGAVLPQNPRLLYHAVYHGSVTMAKMLLDRGIGTPNQEFVTAATYRCADILDLLLERGADIHADDDVALRNTATNVRLTMVQLLLDRGADIHARDDEALRVTCFEDFMGEVVLCLLGKGANIHACTDQALVNRVVEILLDQGAHRSVLDDADRIAQVEPSVDMDGDYGFWMGD
ncbi:hypothetical protein M427DRAFT_182222 [Gonapodya prolifera JEL478]|uniref:Uncharacterized protein n=1 Tax=Gonapodya prolifera (strain JEL478) TaxID=1344416 RepID=A0A139A0P8_GONPJ|nr:hypothetical protein M427DRAFT_182222 [Gonapodya prolifera JEL478]|eukprot:KXS10312.1 hypothetical protein M427DRAFT_182222 [Gonapodya prolifera JEL478]